jgi:hypothetical protein
MLHMTGINAAGDKTFASFALFANYKSLCILRTPAVNEIELAAMALHHIRTMDVGAALAANNC